MGIFYTTTKLEKLSKKEKLENRLEKIEKRLNNLETQVHRDFYSNDWTTVPTLRGIVHSIGDRLGIESYDVEVTFEDKDERDSN